jgi:hypothetical protein
LCRLHIQGLTRGENVTSGNPCAINLSASVQQDGVHQFLASKDSAANEANLFRAAGQSIFVIYVWAQ